MMLIDGVVVCENYSDYLEQSIGIWARTLRHILIVSSRRDMNTFHLAMRHGCNLWTTDVFWGNGASFNKGAALAEAYGKYSWPEWVLFFDADIVPPENWLEQIQAKEGHPKIGNLYGCHRRLESGKKIVEGEITGSFAMFHGSDPNAQVRPIVDTHWTHAGNYDSTFQDRWSPERRIKFGMEVTHLGEPFRNWCGRGNDDKMNELWAERKRKQGWKHERIDRPESN